MAEKKDHLKYSLSFFRRFAHAAGSQKGRFDEKAAKEEKEYFDALAAQKVAEDELDYVMKLKTEVEEAKANYEAQARRHKQLQSELDLLYDSIFERLNPEFPEEDQKELAYKYATERFEDSSRQLEHERHVLHILRQMSFKLYEARMNLDKAYKSSQRELFGGDGPYLHDKRTYVERAGSSFSQVRMLQRQVMQFAPRAGSLGPVDIKVEDRWKDMVFGKHASHEAMYDEIKDCDARIGRVGDECEQLVSQQEDQVKAFTEDLSQKKELLKEARVELQKVREEAFRKVALGQLLSPGVDEELPTEPPPAYSA